MEYHAMKGGHVVLVYADDMHKYERIDSATVAATRRADILAGRALVPKGTCHFCGCVVGRGPLWCSTGCAQEYTAERQVAHAGRRA
jgi:hypothetical protein